MHQLPPPLAPMGAYRQFLCYALTPSADEPGKMDKIPLSPYTGQAVSAHDPNHWTTAEHACAVASQWGQGYGVAFSFQRSDPFFFVDIDNCRLSDGSWTQTALQIAALFPGAAMELSQSGRGMHIFGVGHAPEHGKKNKALKLEFYTELRFAALTGIGAVGSAATDHTQALHAITAAYFPPHASANGDFELTTEPDPAWRGPTDDADLIRRALNSRSAASMFGNKASFADLWERNVDVLARAFPDDKNPYDASDADAALVSHLAFWTGRHGERIERIMRQSGLVREKWNREDYLPRTICEILARGGDVLTDKAPEPPALAAAAPEAPQQAAIEGNTFLSPAAQVDLFRGCVYVQDQHRVLVPGGHMLKPDQFRAAYGGYAFAMDAVNERTTRNAWEAFTESQCLRAPRAETTCFKPELPPGVIVDDAGTKQVNTWWPAKVARLTGDVTPFMIHLRKVLPDERDQSLLLSYMAAVVQHKGLKFQWMPVLQGAEGNGKTLFSRVVARAVGQRYTHWIPANKLASQFNQYLSNKVFLAIEELYVQDHSIEVIEELKTVIAGGDGVQIESKGVDQVSREICINAIGNTNFKAAIRKTPDNARRFGLFYTAQQSFADIVRDGMTGDYFPKLMHWLKAEQGFAIVSELLHSYPIPPELNPAGAMHRAPTTSTTDAAIVESRGTVEQEIAEAIAQDTPGFMGGWVSSHKLDVLIKDTLKMGSRMSRSRCREIMQGMGYVLHPGLADGRVNNVVQPDGRKPQLFVLATHPAAQLRGAADIARAYTAAQSITQIMRA